jgi:hypothetical protein
MSPFWAYFWPPFAFALAVALAAGLVAFRREQVLILVIAAAIAIAGAFAWHGPAGAADRFASTVEDSARQRLVDWEMPQVQAHLHRNPLTRRLLLSGPADDFQQSELVRIMSDVPGVSRATWSGSAGIPLIVEGVGAALLGFLLGLLLAYGSDRRRRYNAQWKW